MYFMITIIHTKDFYFYTYYAKQNYNNISNLLFCHKKKDIFQPSSLNYSTHAFIHMAPPYNANFLITVESFLIFPQYHIIIGSYFS